LGFQVHMPEYLEECTLKPGLTPAITLDEEKSMPRVDWNFLLGDTETKFHMLKERLASADKRNWVEQTEIRDQLLEVNKELMELISQL